MTRPFKLDAFQAVGRLVHLEKHHHQHRPDRLVGEDDSGVTVAEIESSGQLYCSGAELPEQLVCGFAPMSLPPNLSDPGFRINRPGKHQDREQDLPKRGHRRQSDTTDAEATLAPPRPASSGGFELDLSRPGTLGLGKNKVQNAVL